MKRLWAVFLAVLGFSASPALAEKLKGNIWNLHPLVVEGTEIVLTPATRLEGKGRSDLSADDLAVGWRVEVDGAADEDGRFAATKLSVRSSVGEKVRLEGYVESSGVGAPAVEGRRIRSSAPDAAALRPGLYVEAEGGVLDDGTVDVEKLDIQQRRRDDGAETYLALAALELEALGEHVSFREDGLLLDYLGRVGSSLVPAWAEREGLSVRVHVVDDPEPSVLAFPDGTIVVHSGLVAAVESEAQLAVVLGHEIAHVVHEHGHRRYQRSKRAERSRTKSLGAVVSASTIEVHRPAWEGPSWARELLDIGATHVLDASMHGLGDDLEAEADRVGLGYTIAAGYDPSDAPRAWERLSAYVSRRESGCLWFFGGLAAQHARLGIATQEVNLFYRDLPSLEPLRRNDAEHARAVAALRRDLAASEYERGEPGAAEHLLRELLERDAGDPVAHLLLGKVLWTVRGAEGADEALGELRLASELAPALAECYREMGFIYRSLGYRESAAGSFARYVELAPDAEDAAELSSWLEEPH